MLERHLVGFSRQEHLSEAVIFCVRAHVPGFTNTLCKLLEQRLVIAERRVDGRGHSYRADSRASLRIFFSGLMNLRLSDFRFQIMDLLLSQLELLP